jgi:hypothetical protein
MSIEHETLIKVGLITSLCAVSAVMDVSGKIRSSIIATWFSRMTGPRLVLMVSVGRISASGKW